MQTGDHYDSMPSWVHLRGSLAFHFTGKERDTESGLDYFGARYYGSSMGRFMSPDWAAKAQAVPYAKLDNPQTLNLYAYVGNNPLSKADADGHDPDDLDFMKRNGVDWDNLPVNRGFYAQAPRPQTTDSITVTAKPSKWQKVKDWFGSKVDGLSYAMTAFVITHSNSAMEGNRSSFEYWSKQSNEDIIKSLNPGGKEPMQIRMEGEDARVLNGNMRLSILQSRGADLGGLKPEVLPPVSLEPMVEPQIDPEIIP